MNKHSLLAIAIPLSLLALGIHSSFSAATESDITFETSNSIDQDYEKELKRLSNSREYSTQTHVELEYKYAELWDIELNSIYKKLLAVLEQEEQDLLREAQRGWLQYHEKEKAFCQRTFYGREDGPILGTLGRIEAAAAIRERLRKRALELMWHYWDLGYEVEFGYGKK